MPDRWIRAVLSGALGLSLAVLPAAPRLRASEMQLIRVATLAPKNSPFLRSFEELDQNIRQLSQGKFGFQMYSSGVAGDELAVVRKMRVGQLDSGMVTSEGLGLMVPEVNVLRAPGVITSYADLGAVTKELLPDFEAAFEQKGFKLISWGEAGEYRYFSREPIRHPDDIKRMRPWLWPQSPVMQETWRAIGATPVPLPMPEVFGALQTRMVDVVESTSLQYVALQWQGTGQKYVASEVNGVLMGAWVMNKPVFDALPPELRQKLVSMARENSVRESALNRETDASSLRRLVDRKFEKTQLTPEGKQAFDRIHADVRKRLVGRVYPEALLARVLKLAQKPGT
jgi:TRAP-type C4-dicarboxylate transport system substrate-binding protein